MTHLYKQDNGNLLCKPFTNAEEEELLRADGFVELEELFPTAKGRKKKQ